jgi:type 1 glutamine amidotransferase
MRLHRMTAIVLFSLAATGMALSQPPAQPKGGPGGKGKGGPDTSYIGLFQNPQVRAELKLTDDQLAKLPAASLAALADIFDAQQLKRLRGIYLQQKGNAAYLEADIKKELKITSAQANSIQAALDEQTKAQAALIEAGGFDPAKMQELQKSTTAKIQGALTQDQKTAWTSLVGQPFQLAGGFGGKGGGGKGNLPAFAKMIELAEAAIPDKAPAKPKQPRKLLIYSKTTGFRHSSIELGVRTLTALGEKTGAFKSYATEDESIFEREKLKTFDGVFMVSTTGDFLRPSGASGKDRDAREEVLRKSLVDFVSSGKGLMGLHAATDSYPKSWPLYANIIGGGFQSHPWTKLVPVKNVDPNNPVNASLDGKDFEVDDEIYQFRLDTAKATQLRYLLVLDVAKMGPDAARGNRQTSGPYPVSWIANVGKGRVYYNSLGHREQIFWNPQVLKHYLAGIQLALGDLEADATPTAK